MCAVLSVMSSLCKWPMTVTSPTSLPPHSPLHCARLSLSCLCICACESDFCAPVSLESCARLSHIHVRQWPANQKNNYIYIYRWLFSILFTNLSAISGSVAQLKSDHVRRCFTVHFQFRTGLKRPSQLWASSRHVKAERFRSTAETNHRANLKTTACY